MSEHRYSRPPVPATLELTATELKPMLAEVVHQAKTRGGAEEAMAVMVSLWDQWMAAEKDHQKALRRSSTPKTDLMLASGQLIGIKAAIGAHLARHRHLVRKP